MNAFRGFLVVLFLAIAVYTVFVGINHGWNLIPIFFGDIAAMTWPGQFNVDFLCFLLMSGLWVSWRHQFSPAGLGLGFVALFGGMLFLSVYLLIASMQVQGDVNKLLLGEKRAAGISG